MRQELAAAVYDFAAQLQTWSDIVRREPWGRDSGIGRDVVAQLSALSSQGLTDAQQIAAGVGPVEIYQAKKVLGLAAAATEIASKCPQCAIRDTIEAIATNLHGTVLKGAPSLAAIL